MLLKDKPCPVVDVEHATSLLEPLTHLVIQAGLAILAIDRRTMAVRDKMDGTRVTAADLAADHIIAEGLAKIAPEIPVLSEERTHLAQCPYEGSFFLIDPLDGTKEFIAHRHDYTVNLAIISNGTPLLGIVGAPALSRIWRGIVGRGAERVQLTDEGSIQSTTSIQTKVIANSGQAWKVAVSRSHLDPRTEAFIEGRPCAERHALGSAVKFARVAEGAINVYPRLAPTSEWDVAAGHALVVAAGGKVTDLNGASLHFGSGQDGFIIPEFIAWGDPSETP